ncbi:MAG: LytTR family transcriptional regulator [Saprospiraceae bacterium]|nr:LytTR family transcriptional regulator [Saprospiraceae bacterium]
MTVAKTLRIFWDYLGPQMFFRISRSIIVNIDHIHQLNRNHAPSITLTDHSTTAVSAAR